MYAVKYHKPETEADAVALLGAEDAKVLAGGQTLIPTMKSHLAAPSDLVDIRAIPGMKGIAVRGNEVVIGAATTHVDVATDSTVRSMIPGLAALASGIGDPAVRAVGTIGGSVANNDPAADYPSAVLALGATVVTNRREIAADDFFTGMFSTALDDDEIIVAIRFPAPEASAYAKFDNPASRYAIVGVFIAKTASGARVAVTGAGEDGVHRNAALEAGVAAGSVDGVTVEASGMISDVARKRRLPRPSDRRHGKARDGCARLISTGGGGCSAADPLINQECVSRFGITHWLSGPGEIICGSGGAAPWQTSLQSLTML